MVAFLQKRVFFLLDALVAEKVGDFRRGGLALFDLAAQLLQFGHRFKELLLVPGGLLADALEFDEIRTGNRGGFPGCRGGGWTAADQFFQRVQLPVAVVDPALNDALVPVRPRLLHVDVVAAGGVELLDRADVVPLVAKLNSFLEGGVAEPPGIPRREFRGGQRRERRQNEKNEEYEISHALTNSRNLWRNRGAMVNTSSSSPRSL